MKHSTTESLENYVERYDGFTNDEKHVPEKSKLIVYKNIFSFTINTFFRKNTYNRISGRTFFAEPIQKTSLSQLIATITEYPRLTQEQKAEA